MSYDPFKTSEITEQRTETRCVGQVKTKKVKLRGRVALADIRLEVNTRSLDG